MNKFTIGLLTGAASLAIAVPIVAQMSSAAGVASSSVTGKPIPSQACVQALADGDATMLSDFDAMITAHKAALKAHHDALTAASALADDTARQAAVEKANQDLRDAMKTFMQSHKDDRKAQMDALKAACGDAFPHRGMGFGPMMGGMPGFGGKGFGFGHHGHHGMGHGPMGPDTDQETNDDGGAQHSTSSAQ